MAIGRYEMDELKEGIKYDKGKIRFDLIPADSLLELAKVYTKGARKYEDNNWRKGMSWSRIFAAMMRHAWAWFMGEDLDQESGLHHMAHVAWGCFILINYRKTRSEFDDRINMEFDMDLHYENVKDTNEEISKEDYDIDITVHNNKTGNDKLYKNAAKRISNK